MRGNLVANIYVLCADLGLTSKDQVVLLHLYKLDTQNGALYTSSIDCMLHISELNNVISYFLI